MTKQYYELQGKLITDEDRYLHSPNNVANFLQYRRIEKSVELVIKNLKKLSRDQIIWLDVGCGDGIILREVMKRLKNNIRVKLLGLDIAKSKLQRLKHNCPQVDVIVGDALNIPFKNNSLSIVTCFELIEHFEKEEGIRILREIHRVLLPRGILILSTPSYYSPREYLARKSGNLGEHKYIYKQRELVTILRSIGFEVLNVTSSGFMIPIVIFGLGWKLTEILLNIAGSKPLIIAEKIINKIKGLKNLNWTTFIICKAIK